ncbi:hypothetical protein ACOMHN_049998 [Nucella lapillus]
MLATTEASVVQCTNTSEEQGCVGEVSYTVFVLLMLLGLLVLTGNALTIAAILTTPDLNKKTNRYIFHLAIADVIVGVSALWWSFSFLGFFHWAYDRWESLCVFGCVLVTVSVTQSFLTVTLLAVDRLLYVERPFLYERWATDRLTKTLMICCWCYSGIYGTCVCLSHTDFSHPTGCMLFAVFARNVNTIAGPVHFLAVVCVTSVCYVRIACLARGHRRRITAQAGCFDQEQRPYEQNTHSDRVWNQRACSYRFKSAGSFVMVNCLFVLCWMPLMICVLVAGGEDTAVTSALGILSFLAMANSGMNCVKEQTLLCPSVASNGNGVTVVSLTSTLPLFTPTTPTSINGSQEGLSTSTTVNPCPNNGTKVTICWETMIGQEVFKLTIMDLIFTLGQIFIIDVFRSIFVKYCSNICCWDLQKKFPEYPDFKTAENLLHLINNQGNIWLGVFFSPGLALLNFLKLLLLMYVRCWTVIVCNVPQERIFRASRSNNFYFALLLVMLFLCMLPPLFAIVGIEPSPQCGPFSGLNRIYKVLTKTMENELPASVNSVMDYAASPGVILPIFMLMAMTIYYLVSIGRSLRDANSELRMMLEYERTEGRKKVYAMADAKHDLDQPDGPKNPGISKMASAVSSVLKAAQMAKMFGALGAENKRKQPKSSEAGQKMAPAVRPKPHVPVAVVHGKRSLKRNAAAVRNRAAAVRHLQQQGRQAQGSSRETLAGTNGHMLVTPTSSLETPDVSSNEEEDVFSSSHSSSRSSHAFHQHHDDPAAIVDHTGHLRPVTEDDVHLDVDSDSEDDEELYDDGDHKEPEEARDVFVSTAPVPKRTTKQRQSAAVPPVRSKSSRPSRKIGPTEIPRITVVDFGEDEVADEDQNEEDSAETHVEPRVIVENELNNNRHRHRKNRVASAQAQENERIQLRTKKSSKTHQKAAAGVTHSEGLHSDPVRPQRTVPAKPNTDGSCEAPTRTARESNFRTERERDDGGVDNTEGKKTQGKAAKAKFSNILARFQKMDDKG